MSGKVVFGRRFGLIRVLGFFCGCWGVMVGFEGGERVRFFCRWVVLIVFWFEGVRLEREKLVRVFVGS